MSLPFLLKKDERVIRSGGARFETKKELTTQKPGMFGIGTRVDTRQVDAKGESGTLYLTNTRIVFVISKGLFSKTTQIVRNTPLTDIENISVSGTLGKGLNIDWAGGAHDRFSGLDDPVAWENEIKTIITG